MKFDVNRLTIVGALAFTVSAVACSAIDDSKNPNANNGQTSSVSSGGNDGGGGATASGGAGGNGSADGGGGIFNPAGSGGGGGEDSCLSTSVIAEKKALDIVMVWDRSGSMGGASWNGTVSAVTQFVQDPASEGVSIGLNFFPLDGATNTCDPDNSNPPQTPLTLLPMGAQDVVNAINAESPGGGTPTYGALWGTLSYLTAYKDMNPNHVVAAVLASDGFPNGCPGNQNQTSSIATLAQSAFNYNGVRTYAIAIQGASVADLDQIAAAGGTTAAFDVTSNITLFKQKMEEIRSDALGCDYEIADLAQMGGEEFDPTKLNLSFTPGGGMDTVIPQANNEFDCGGNHGWYYDNPNNPTKVLLCPVTCTAVQSDGEATVDFQFGCPTIPN